ncbi:winged helix DNA-binding domain-containing protein [Microbacterium dauci]|uniref:Winged helix DNA-binding domain-containing protein n=1 Tax=Microbacterium dauci TaxID=3048008 RepID=A0ABT6ZB43_9MICO|nr:winged helix DNA-binding domain-containing protein [Microbacterium sp. LX3-4]MDJ1112862.1 winged helix DNA-binding domain-containing protein [Microbacterium sp. LX3-4]
MDISRIRDGRLRAQLLTAPAADVVAAASHLLATQAQDFWAGRWALGVRSAGDPVLSQVDAAFASGELVRSWTQRGTVHIVPACDLPWILAVTGARQQRAAAGVLRGWGIGDDDLAAAERAVRPALAGGNRLTRSEFAEVIAATGVDPSSSRGNHVLTALAIRGVLALGEVVPRDGITRDQYLVSLDGLASPALVADPLVELWVRYIRAHGPASPADFSWWAGLPLRDAQVAASAADPRVAASDETRYSATDAAPAVDSPARTHHALAGWDEYFLSYADRTLSCDPGDLAAVGPTQNGLVRPILVADGIVRGTWSYSTAVGKTRHPPVVTLFEGAGDAAGFDAALRRVVTFTAG